VNDKTLSFYQIIALIVRYLKSLVLTAVSVFKIIVTVLIYLVLRC